ncbi:EcsC family protein [Pseudonocardia sp. D17]|uniref:EcsC family protein n=1 Tax=Pseudonocardia sp. D17 TaxID=882661 RepID=UPI002B3FA810|nr:hypothetical protein PSD17_23730 [Pseudonocardia sp. D17]
MAVEKGKLAELGEGLVDQVLSVGINGRGRFNSAKEVADEHLATYTDVEQAIRKLVGTNTRLAAASGFVTGLGGVAALPVTIPAALAGLYILAGRMSAAVAYMRGYDIDSEEVRSAVLVSLLGSSGAEVLKRTGVEIGRKSTAAAFQRIPGRALIEINKKVGYRLVTKAGEKGVINLGKLVPFVGAPVGAAVDAVGCRTNATYALKTFEPITGRTGMTISEPEVVDATATEAHVRRQESS